MTRKNSIDSPIKAIGDSATMSGIKPEYQAETHATAELGIKLVTILACLHLLIVAGIIINNLSYPTILDNSEATNAFTVYAAGVGMRLYGPTSPFENQPFYPPLAYNIMGVVSSWFGYDIRSMRLVAAVFSTAAFVLLGMTVYRITRNKYLSLIGAALFAGAPVGNWYCYIHPDAFHICFAVLAVYLLAKDMSLRWSTVFAVILALFASFWSKQTGLAYLAAGLLYFWIKDWRKGIAATIFASLLFAGFAGYYINQPESSFLFMIFTNAANDPIIWKGIFNPVIFPEILGRYGIMCAIVIAGIIGLGWKWKNWIRPEYVFLGAGAVDALLGSLKYGSGIMHALFFYGMLIVCGMYFLNKFRQENNLSLPLMLGLLIVQSVVLSVHEYSSGIITSEDDKRYRQILDIMATPGKKVHYIAQPFYNIVVGTQAHPAIGHGCRRRGVYDRSLYPEVLRKFFESDPFDIIIADVPLEDNSWLLYERINKNYVPVMEIPADTRRIGGNTLRNRKIVFYRKDLVGPRPQ